MRRQGWLLVGVLMTAMLRMPVFGQVALTTVQDTVYSASGTPASGTVIVSWNAFTTADGQAIAAGSTSVTLGSGGTLSVGLAPNAGANPQGSYYTATFHLADGTTSRQFWVVPANGPATLATVQSQVLPTSVASQTVSKSYVDAAIARALTGTGTGTGTVASGSYVQKSGDTMSGPLLLPGDPVSAQQAADKHYVDANVGAVSAGLATKVTTLPVANQAVAQPAGTQLEVNSLNGMLDATGFLTGNGSNGFANALASANCANGCNLTASQNYPGGDGMPLGGMPDTTHVSDHRGGVNTDVFINPLGVGSPSMISSSITQVTTRSAQQMAAARPGIVGTNSFVMSLTQTAAAGGSNQFPALEEGSVPYNKSNFGVLQLTGNYNTAGQHVQLGNEVNCFSVGDCLAGGQFIVSSGGYRDQADEGTHPFDLQVGEDSRVFRGTCAAGCTTGSTKLAVAANASGGTQGDGRFLINTNPSKVISTGSITGSTGDLLPIIVFSGTNFPTSVFFETAQGATSQSSTNLQPGMVTLAIATSGVASGHSTNTSALSSSTGVACIADTGPFPNFETANYKVMDATHLQLTLNKVHKAGALVGIGGLCGYGLEAKVDTVGNLKQVFPVVGSPSPTKLYYASALTGVVGWSGNVNTGGYLNTSLPIASVVRSGGTVTLTTAGSLPYDLNGLPLTVSGVNDSSFNGTFQVATTGPNTLTFANSGADGSSTGGTVGITTGSFALYPMAEVLSVFNPASSAIDGTMTLAANTVPWANGDPVEQPHYFQQLVDADTEYITQFVPRPIQYSSAGKLYNGQVGPGTRGWQIQNTVPASNYLGGGGTHQPPDAAFLGLGVWRNAFETDAGQESVVRVHCNLHGCNRWDSAYALFSMDSHAGQDFLFFDPSSDTASWNLYGTTYSFSPSSFNAPTINAGVLNATKIAGGSSFSSADPNGTTLPLVNTSGGGAQYNIEVTGSASIFPNNGLIYHDVSGGYYPFWYSNGAQAGLWAISGALFGWSSHPTDPRANGGGGLDTAFLRRSPGYICASASPFSSSCNGTLGAGRFHETLSTPSSSSAACEAGDFTDDVNFHYVCVATNTWRRVALSSF